MRTIVASIESEYARYRALGESAMRQLTDLQLADSDPSGSNSVATVAWHLGGNLASRFTDFLTTDGEKPWRDREEEFAVRQPSRQELLAHWSRGWDTLMATLRELTDAHLSQQVTIRQQPLAVHEALHRSLAHTSYHVGQMVYRARSLCGDRWEYQSIPPGQSSAYNQAPTLEKPDAHAARLNDEEV